MVVIAAAMTMPAPSAAHDLVDPPVGSATIEAALPHGWVARVGPTLISRNAFVRWRRIGAATADPAGRGELRRRRLVRITMEFLLRARWVALEAREHGIAVSRAELLREVRQEVRNSFSTDRAFRRFRKDSRMTERDIRFQIRFTMLGSRLADHALAGATEEEVPDLVDAFDARVERKWRARTRCARTLVVELCSNRDPVRRSSFADRMLPPPTA